MYKILATVLVLLCAFHHPLSAQSFSYVIKGKLPELFSPARAFLLHEKNGVIKCDSANIVKGRFDFHATAINKTRTVYLIISKSGRQMDTEAISLRIYTDTSVISVVRGDGVDQVEVIAGQMNRDDAALQKALSRFEANSDEADEDESPARDDVYIEFIKTHPRSFVSLEALRKLGGNPPDPAIVEPLFASLAQTIRDSRPGKAYAEKIAVWKKIVVGRTAPDFTLYDTSGRAVSLHDFRGQYVLLDFWASWCVPCREENPNLLAAFERCRDRQFTVVGVTLDNPDKKLAWMKAIHEDGLSWTHLASDSMWYNIAAELYSVKSIPQNFLINPDGIIIARHLRGAALHEKLRQVLPARTANVSATFTNP